MRKPKISLHQVALFGMLGALTFAAKVAMSVLPNIEPVSLMVMLFAVVFGLKAVYPIYLYVLLEILFYGIQLWNINYLYIWLILAGVSWLLRRREEPLFWALVSAGFGLLFGLLCAPVDFLLGDIGYVAAKWASGIPFDIMHCIGNFCIALVLFVPLRRLLEKLYRKMQN